MTGAVLGNRHSQSSMRQPNDICGIRSTPITEAHRPSLFIQTRRRPPGFGHPRMRKMNSFNWSRDITYSTRYTYVTVARKKRRVAKLGVVNNRNGVTLRVSTGFKHGIQAPWPRTSPTTQLDVRSGYYAHLRQKHKGRVI